MRIIHFSDIHVAPQLDSISSYFDKRLLGYFNYRFRRQGHMNWSHVARFIKRVKALQPDIVICTGDITTLGEPREFAIALNALAPLVEDQSIEFLYVPGNHDAYIKNKDSQISLHQAFKTLNRERWRLDQLPLVHTFGELQFLLINEGCPAPLWGSYGELDKRSRKWLDSQLATTIQSPQKTVLVSHFPLFDATGKPLNWRRGCRHIAPLQNALQRGDISLALCGHIHKPFSRQAATGGLESCAGSLTQTGMFTLIEYEARTGSFQTTQMPAVEGTLVP